MSILTSDKLPTKREIISVTWFGLPLSWTAWLTQAVVFVPFAVLQGVVGNGILAEGPLMILGLIAVVFTRYRFLLSEHPVSEDIQWSDGVFYISGNFTDSRQPRSISKEEISRASVRQFRGKSGTYNSSIILHLHDSSELCFTLSAVDTKGFEEILKSQKTRIEYGSPPNQRYFLYALLVLLLSGALLLFIFRK